MADKKIKIDIEAIDSFSSTMDKLNKKIKELNALKMLPKAGEKHIGDVLGSLQMDTLRLLSTNKIDNMGESLKDLTNRAKESIKILERLIATAEMVNKLKPEKEKTVEYKSKDGKIKKGVVRPPSSGRQLNENALPLYLGDRLKQKAGFEIDGAIKKAIEDFDKKQSERWDAVEKAGGRKFKSGKSEISEEKLLGIRTVPDKKSVEDTKKKLKNEFKNNKVTQKVTIEEETKSKNTTKEKVKPTETKTKKETVAKETPKKEKESKETTSKVEAPKTVEQTVKTNVKADVDKSSVAKAINEIQKEVNAKPVKVPIEAIDNFSKLVGTGRQKNKEVSKEELTGIGALFKSWDSLVDKAKSEREHRGGKPLDEKLQSEEVVEKQEKPKKSKKKQKEIEISSIEEVQEPHKKVQEKQKKEEALTQKVEFEVDKESIKKVQREAQQELDKKSLKVSVVPDKADFASEYEKVAKRIQKYNKLHPNEEFDITKARKKVNNFRGGNETDKELKHEFQIDNFIKKLATQGKKLEDVLPLERIQRLFAATQKNRQEIAEAKKDEVKKPKETVTEVIEPVVDNRAVNKIKKDVQKELNAPPVEMEVKVEEKKPKKEKKETATPEEKVSKITVDEKLTKGVQQIPIDGILKKLIVDKGATDTVIKAISSLTGNISNIKIDQTALSKSLSTTIRELNKTPFDIKVGKDEKYFTKVINDNIKKVSKEVINLKAKIDKVGYDKEVLSKFNKEINLKAVINSFKLDSEKLQKFKERIINLKAEIKSVKINPDSLTAVKDRTVNIKGLIKPLIIDKEALSALKAKELKIKAIVNAIKLDNDKLQQIKDRGINLQAVVNSIKVDNDKLQSISNKTITVKGIIKPLTIDKDALAKLKEKEIKLKGVVSNIKSRKSVEDTSTNKKGYNKSKAPVNGEGIFTNETKNKFKTLQQKRNRAVVDMDKAYQDYGKDSDAFKKAQDRYRVRQQELQDFQLSAGVGGNINSVINDLKRQYAAYDKNEPVQSVIRDELSKAIAQRDRINEELKNLDPNEGEKAYNAFNKGLESMIRAMSKHEAELEKLTRKAQERDRKESEKARDAVFKEANDSDAHTTQLLDYRRKAEQKAFNDALKEEIRLQKELNQTLKMRADYIKNAAKSETAEQKQANFDARHDLKNSLMSQAFNAKNVPIDQANLDKFLADLEKYKDITDNISPNFYKNMGKQLRIGKDHPYFEQLKQLQLQAQEAEKAWRDSEQKKEKATKDSAQNIKNQYQSLAQKAKEVATEAEKAWRMHGGKPSPEFEELKNQFQEAMKNLVNFRKSLGNLSAGAEANIFSNMARSLGKSSPLYDEMIQKVKKLKREQKELNDITKDQKTPKGSGRLGSIGGFLTGITQFFGRSSKGFGSFLEAVARVQSNMVKFGGSLATIGVIMAGLTAVMSGVVTSLNLVASTAQTLGNILMQIGQTIFQALRPGIELYEQQQHAIFSFTAAIKSSGIVSNEQSPLNGQRLTDLGERGTEIARGLSRQLIDRATLDAELSAFSLEELLRSLQGTLPLLMGRGMSLEQAYEVNKGVAGVAKMTQLSPNQILQETRDLAQGSITARTSQVANALGITNADIAKYKGNADELFKYLMGKFKEYGELLSEFEDTAVGRWQQLLERYQMTTKTIVDGLAPMFKGVFEEIIAWTGTYRDKNGNYLDAIAGQWKKSNGEIIGTIKEVREAENHLGVDMPSVQFHLSDEMQDVKSALQEIIHYIAQSIDGVIQWAKETTGITDPIEVAKEGIKFLIDGFLTCVRILGEIFGWLYKNRESMFSIVQTTAKFILGLHLVISAVMFIVSAFKLVLGAIVALFKPLAKLQQMVKNPTEIIVRLVKGDFKGAGDLIASVFDGYGDSIKNDLMYGVNEFLGDAKNTTDAFNALMSVDDGSSLDQILDKLKIPKVQGKATTAVTKYSESGERNKHQGKTEGIQATDVRGEPKADDKEAAKAAKQALKEAQKALKEAIEKLKQELKDKLDELKEAQEVDDIAYKEGFMSMKDYYTEKARREQEEAQLRLAEAQAEKELISQTPFENEYDKLKELHKVSREIREYERAVAKTTRALGEVEHQIGKYTKSMQVMQQLQRQPIQTMMSGGQQAGAASFGALMSDNPQTLEDKMAWAMKAAMQAGFDKESAAAMVGNWVVESGGNLNPNAVGDNGTSYGIAQWHNERWDELIRWAKENASDPSDFRTQVMFALHEILKGRERGNFVSNNGDLRTQTWNYAKNVERPATWALNQSFSSRYGNAQKAYELAGKSISQVATSLGVTVNDVNKELVQLGQVIETLVSSTGELLGYKAPQQYSRSGIDTRYSRFQSMSGGVDTQISGLKPQVIQAINLVAKEFFEKTGEQIEWTSFTGSNLHQKGEWGHYAGWKADANIDPKYYEILKQILGKLGVGAGVEDFGGANQHVDISFAKGGVGGDVLTTPTGTEFYNKLSNAITANGVNVNLHEEQVKSLISDEFKKELAEVLDVDKDEKQRATFESMFRESANTTKLGHEVNEEALDRLQKLYELREKNTSRVSGNTLESNMLLMIKYTRQMMAARSDPEMLGELKLGFQLEKLDLAAEKISKFLDTNLEDVENKLKLDISKLQLGEIDATAITEYITKQLTDTSDPLGLAKGIEDLEKTYAEYISRGMREDAQRIKSKIQSIRDSMVSYFDKLRETVLQPWEMSEKIFNATPKYTSTQREFAEREFTAYKAEAELSIVNAHIASNNERLEETRQKIKDVEESLNGLNNAHADEIANIKESQAGLNLELENEKALYDKLQAQLEKYSDTTTDVVQKETELKALQDKQKAIESQQKLNLQQKEYLELLKQQPNYLNDVANAANEALDKGLNELLTDGVNNAKSLGEAFRNLAVGILKEIQRVSAKWLVKGFMNKFVGQFHVDEKGNSQMGVQATTQALVTTNQQLNATGQMLLQALGVNVGATPMQTTTPVFKSTEGLLDVNNPFANPWEQSTLNPNAQVPQQQPFTFDTGINLVDKSVERFGTALDKTSSMQLPAFDDGMNNVTKALTSGNSIDTTMQQVSAKTSTVFETVFAQFQTAGEQLVQAVQSVATRLQSVMFPGGAPGAYTGGFVKNNKILKLARGGAVYHNSGLVTGYGTSTSDDIPAMLSNGEAVLNAKAVKRLGLNFISAVNNGEFSKIRASVPHFASGGIVGEAQQSTARGMTDFAKGVGTEVSTNNNVNIALVRDENEAMETFMKSPQGERIMANFQKKSARIFYRS